MNKGNGCGGCCGGKNHTMHMILKVLLLALIFMCGFKLGMVTGYIGHGYERGGMMGRGVYGQNFDGQGYGMMRGYKNVQAVPATTTPATTPAKN